MKSRRRFLGGLAKGFSALGIGSLLKPFSAGARSIFFNLKEESIFLKNTNILKGIPTKMYRNGAHEHVTVTRIWNFYKVEDLQGWKAADGVSIQGCGGALKIRLADIPWLKDAPGYQPVAWFSPVATSPQNLGIPGEKATQIHLRLLNRSPETDGLISWRTEKEPSRDAGSARFSFKAFEERWQEVVCYIDNKNEGIDQIQLRMTNPSSYGDLFIHSIAITDGARPNRASSVEIDSETVVPKIIIPGIKQDDFRDAFRVLRECLITNVPVHGFTHPVMGPGGGYGENWWQLDSSLAVAGSKWSSQAFAEGVMLGFSDVQAINPDGRIDLWGASPVRGMPSASSSLPRIFETGYDTARRCHDRKVRLRIYQMLQEYLDWWLSPVKRDTNTGLIAAIGEETFSDGVTGISAAVDTNVAVCVGLQHVSKLAKALGRAEEAIHYQKEFEALKYSINKYLWSEERKAYLNLDLDTHLHSPVLACTTFDPLRFRIADKPKINFLLEKLQDPSLFNWGDRPLTSIAKTDKRYLEATGVYDGRAWFGDIWTLRNTTIVKGIREIGRNDLSSELAWSTIKTFNGRYVEYITPTANTIEGQPRYAWSASQYIELVIEYLFGIDYDALEHRLRIMPSIPQELRGERLSVESLILPSGRNTRLTIKLMQHDIGNGTIEVDITGELQGQVEILIPSSSGKFLSIHEADGKSYEKGDEILNKVPIRFTVSKESSKRKFKWITIQSN